MGFLLQRIDVNGFVSDHFRDARHDSALIFDRQSEIPGGGPRVVAKYQFARAEEAGNVFGTQLAGGKVTRNLDQIRDHRRSRGVTPGAPSVEHLRSDLVAYQEDRVVYAFNLGEHGTATHQPRSNRNLQAMIGVLG